MINLNDVDKIVVAPSPSCKENWPCQHNSKVVLKDGREASGLDSFEICSLVSNIAQEKINPGHQNWQGNDVVEHFHSYRQLRPRMGWAVESPNIVLNRIFRVNMAHMIHNLRRFSI